MVVNWQYTTAVITRWKLIIIAMLSLFIPVITMASDHTSSFQASAGLSVNQFSFEEFEGSDRLLKEAGTLTSVSAELAHHFQQWYIQGSFSYQWGDVEYRGTTQSGSPLKTRTEENLYDMFLEVGRKFDKVGTVRSTVYAGLGTHRWERSIRSTPSASGLLETYNWRYLAVGARAQLAEYKPVTWSINIQLYRILQPEVYVDFGGLFDNQRLDLSEEFGFRLSLPVNFILSQNSRSTVFRIEPFYERLKLGRSEREPLTRNGTLAGTVFEPRSETEIYGASISLISYF